MAKGLIVRMFRINHWKHLLIFFANQLAFVIDAIRKKIGDLNAS